MSQSYGSVCSGIEAASVAWHSLGWRAAWLAEIEPFPAAVLRHHYPDVPNHGDMTALAARVRELEIEAPDVLVGGTPCQAFSVAGLRQSLDDDRGQLTIKFLELADAIDTVRRTRKQPECIIVWENVPGVLNTKDNAFGCFLAGLAGESEPLLPAGGRWTDAGCVYGPTRTVAWRVLDAQYFGLAQRRRRVFVVASARNNFDPAAVLFEFDGVRRDTAPSREAGKVAPTIPARSTGGGGLGTDFDCDGGVITMAHGQGGAEIGFDRGPTLTCNHEAPIVAHTLHGEGYDASEDSKGRGTPLVAVAFHPTQDPISSTDGSTHALGCGSSGGQASVGVAYGFQPRIGRNGRGDMGEVVSALTAHSGETGKGDAAPCVAYPLDLRNALRDPDKHDEQNRQGCGLGDEGDPAPTLTKAHVHGVAIAMRESGPTLVPVGVTIHGTDPTVQKVASYDDVAQCLRARTPGNIDNSSTTVVQHPVLHGCLTPELPQRVRVHGTAGTSPTLSSEHGRGHGVPTIITAAVPVAFEPGSIARNAGPSGESVLSPTLRSQMGDNQPAVRIDMQVRRLTPVECERLQGFPDNYTAIPWRKKPASECPDGPRYKALGNSMAVPVMRWIGERIDNHVFYRGE